MEKKGNVSVPAREGAHRTWGLGRDNRVENTGTEKEVRRGSTAGHTNLDGLGNKC